MPPRIQKTPRCFTEYQKFGLTEDFVRFALDIGWTVHRNDIIATQLVVRAFLYLLSAMSDQDRRTKKKVSRGTKIYLDHPQMVQQLIFILSDIYEQEQEKTSTCSFVDLLIRYIKHLVSFYMEHNSSYVALGQTRFLFDYEPRHLERLFREVAPDQILGGDKQMKRIYEAIYKELDGRFANKLQKDINQHGREIFTRLTNPGDYTNLVETSLRRFNLWLSPQTIHQNSVGKSLHKEMGRAETGRYRILLDINSLTDLMRRLPVPQLQDRWALPDFCLESRGDHPSNIDPPAWTNEEVKTLEDTIAETLARRQIASASLLLIMVNGKERQRLYLDEASTVSLDVKKGEGLIEVISREEGQDIPLAVHRMSYDEELYDNKWILFGERRLTSAVILEGGQKISFKISLKKDADQVVTGAKVKVSYRSPDPLRKAARWWESFQIGDWSPSAVLSPMQALALSIGAMLCIIGFGVYLIGRPSAQPNIVKQEPKPPQVEREKSPELPQPQPSLPVAPQTNQNRLAASATPKAGIAPKREPDRTGLTVFQDISGTVAIASDGTVRLADGEMLFKPLSQLVRELVTTGAVTPDQDVSVEVTALRGDSTRSALRGAQIADNPFPIPVSPILTVIRSTAPTLRWEAVPRAEEYKIRVAYPEEKESGRLVWEGNAGNQTQVTLPSGVLQQGEIYLWQVETIVEDQLRLSPVVGFQVLNANALRKVQAAERSYKNLALVLASVYEAHGLYEEALAQVERLAKMNPTNPITQAMLDHLRHQLGKE